MPEPNVLEVLGAIQAQQVALQTQIALKEALDDSGLSIESKRTIRTQFKDKPLDLGALDDAIAAAKVTEAAKATEAAKLKEPATKEPEPDGDSFQLPNQPAVKNNVELKQVSNRWLVQVDGRTVGNFAIKEAAEANANEHRKSQYASMQQAINSIEQEYENRAKLAECQLLLDRSLRESGLPANAVASLERKFANRTFEADELHTEINGIWDVLTPFYGSGEVNLPGQTRPFAARVLESEFERMCTAFDGFWANEDLKGTDGKPVRRFRSLQEAYEKFMKRPYDPMRILQEMGRMVEGQKYDSHGRYGVQADGRLTEAITTTSWAQIMGDSIARRMLAEYRVPDLQIWRQIVSEISVINDFRTQHRMRFGGYGLLPTVAEGVPYTFLPTPTDQEATFKLAKRGGLESITMEALANDDVGVIRRIPQKLGRAAAQTLFRGIFDMIDQNMVLTFDDDTTALFTAAHGNTETSLLLDAAGLDTAIQKMAAQTSYNNSLELLGLRPRFLLHPAALWRPATKLTQTERGEPGTADNDMNPFLRFGMTPMEIDYWTNATRWYLVADPRDIPTIEVGFFRGNEDPEIFISDQENQAGGSMFEADKITYKIRHVYAYAILDPRAFFGSR